MNEEKTTVQSQLKENLTVLATPEGIQRYVLGTKKSGQPRAIYDIVRDFVKPKKAKKDKKDKKNGKKKSTNTYAFYLDTKKAKKKHKKGKKGKDWWHI